MSLGTLALPNDIDFSSSGNEGISMTQVPIKDKTETICDSYLDEKRIVQANDENLAGSISDMLDLPDVEGVQYENINGTVSYTPIVSFAGCMKKHKSLMTLGNALEKDFLKKHILTIKRDGVVIFMKNPQLDCAGMYMQYGKPEDFASMFPEYNDYDGGWGNIEIIPNDEDNNSL